MHDGSNCGRRSISYPCPFQSRSHTANDNHACRTRPLLCALICTLSRPASCPAPSLGRPSLQAVMRCEATPILSSISPRRCRMSPCSDERFSINSADGRHRWPPCASARCWCCVQDIDWAAVQPHLHRPGGGITQRADGVPLNLLSHLPQPAHARSGTVFDACLIQTALPACTTRFRTAWRAWHSRWRLQRGR